jgi:hypothetical protein
MDGVSDAGAQRTAHDGWSTWTGLPPGLLDARPDELAARLGGPVLIHLPGRRTPALFVSALLHGNEHTGLRAVQRLLRAHAGRELPRALSVFVGNVTAAGRGVRRLDTQPDYNRVWPGTHEPDGPERRMAEAVTRAMRDRGVFAAVDVHNNTGLNPHYACVSRLDARTLHLAALFARIGVSFDTTPRGVLSAAFATFCPAVAIECGKSGVAANDARAAEYLDACLHLSALPDHPVAAHDLELFRTVCLLKVPDAVDFAFGAPADARPRPLAAADDAARQPRLWFDPRLDHLNFRELPTGTALARDTLSGPLPLRAIDDDGRDVTDAFLARDAHGTLRLKRALMPAMLTLDARVIRQDCAGYLMERLALAGASATA